MRTDLDEECDPPCFTAGLQKKKDQQVWCWFPCPTRVNPVKTLFPQRDDESFISYCRCDRFSNNE